MIVKALTIFVLICITLSVLFLFIFTLLAVKDFYEETKKVKEKHKND